MSICIKGENIQLSESTVVLVSNQDSEYDIRFQGVVFFCFVVSQEMSTSIHYTDGPLVSMSAM